MKLTRLLFFFLLASLYFSCQTNTSPQNIKISEKKISQKLASPYILPYVNQTLDSLTYIPKIPREMRASWVASVVNIDLPVYSEFDEDTVQKMQSDIDSIIEKTLALNLNTLFVQVRPNADVYYQSKLEPWSYWLFHNQGVAPPDQFDPLAYWVKQAHKNGLRFHAWINPFRVATPQILDSHLDEKSIAKRHPDWVKKIGPDKKRYLWLDPGIPEARQYVTTVLDELLNLYNIDGLVLDDYFYPYHDYYQTGESFPDSSSYAKYKENGGLLDLHNWRRENINIFIQEINTLVHKDRDDLLFGVSPFGIWRPGYPTEIRGKDAYTEIYTDSKTWLTEGWLDYFVPQLYWPIEQDAQSFTSLLKWWQKQNTLGRHLWPGIRTTTLEGMGPKAMAQENIRQIRATRLLSEQAPGVALFSFNYLTEVSQSQFLKESVYVNPALIPQTPWREPQFILDNPTVTLSKKDDQINIEWKPINDAFNYIVYVLETGNCDEWWRSYVLGRDKTALSLDKAYDQVIVSSIDRLGNEYSTLMVKQTLVSHIPESIINKKGKK